MRCRKSVEGLPYFFVSVTFDIFDSNIRYSPEHKGFQRYWAISAQCDGIAQPAAKGKEIRTNLTKTICRLIEASVI